MEQEVIRAVSVAIRQGDVADLEKLIKQHSIPVDGDPQYFRSPPLHTAISAGKLNVVKWLLENGASATLQRYGNYELKYPLYIALYDGYLDIAKILISHGCKFEKVEEKGEITNKVVRNHDTEMLGFLVEQGMDIQEVEKEYSLVESAINYRNTKKTIDFIDYLIELGADVNNRPRIYDEGALICAIRSNKKELIDHLLKVGADPKIVDKEYCSILCKMIEYGNPTTEEMKRFIDMGVSINARFRGSSETALIIAVMEDKPDVIDSLMELGADINAVDLHDNTALHVAAYSGNTEALKKLIDHGAPLDTKDQHGNTALHRALFNLRKEAAKLLIERGANVDVKNNEGVSAYDYCSKLRTKGGNVALVKLIESVSREHNPESAMIPLDIERGELWANKAREEIEAMPVEQQNLWRELMSLCAKATSSKPTKTWVKKIKPLVEKLGEKQIEDKVLPWLTLLSGKRTEKVDYDDRSGNWANVNHSMMITPYNTTVLKGLIWMLAEFSGPMIPGTLRTVAQTMYKKVYGVGMRNAKIANAAVYSLSQLPGDDGVKEIVILRAQTKYSPALDSINRVYERIAKERNISPEELDELAISDYGMTCIGGYDRKLGDFTAILRLSSIGKTSLTWQKGDKTQKSIPAEVKREYADEVKQLKALAKDIEKASTSFRENLEQTYLKETKWDINTWRERYIDHPLGGFIGQRTIWQFISGDKTLTGIFFDEDIIDVDGKTLNSEQIEAVRLWHPIYSGEHEILAWRNWIIQNEVTQPIKQAFREIYLLTDAERKTGDHSLRFASHILKQHQFNALAQSRRWQQTLAGQWDGGHESSASRELPHVSYSAGFVTNPYDESATTANGIYQYVSTGKVVIYNTLSKELAALEDVPTVIFSEIMRDVDLFVSISSVGNDPDWENRDENPYWSDYGFGDLSNMAETRKQVLETIVPKLKISKQLKIQGRYLHVEGKLRSYRIHMGSGNILMDPDSAYLCIVATRDKSNNIFVPFEGDRQLSLILSKAFLLAADDKIKDPVILAQIHRT